jgi:nucleoside-diphosphate-sugar epimerase
VSSGNVFYNDLDMVCNNQSYDLSVLEGKTVLVTGATGLIGFALASSLLHYGKNKNNAPKLIALVRNIEKAKAMYRDYMCDNLKFLVSDVTKQINIDEPIDYIIHGASQTASKAFVNEPVETIKTAIDGTVNMLELAKIKKVKSFVYLSSMEVYGSPQTDEKITESHSTNLDTMSVRTSYPESKRMCEALCTAYCKQYGVPAKVVRLTQTFGPGVAYNDGRVFAEFARCAIEKKDIILHTKGETKRNYLYTVDAVTAILTVLLKGTSGEAYNAANEDTYCSIYEMAEMVAEKCANNEIKVKLEIADENKFGYAPVLKMNLDTSKLRNLAWKPLVDLIDMFKNLCETMIEVIR